MKDSGEEADLGQRQGEVDLDAAAAHLERLQTLTEAPRVLGRREFDKSKSLAQETNLEGRHLSAGGLQGDEQLGLAEGQGQAEAERRRWLRRRLRPPPRSFSLIIIIS